MEQSGQFTASQIIGSLNGWWELAGVDAAVGDDAVDWLAIDAKPTVAEGQAKPSVKAPKPEPVRQSIEWPSNIGSLREMIQAGTPLPGNSFSTRRVVSVGPENAKLMVVSDLPENDELSEGKLGSGASGALLTRMLAAIGLDLSECYWTSLASTIPATGELPDADLLELAAFLQHHVNLVAPSELILLGSSASRALLDLELMEARQSIRYLNHDGGKKAVLTTFHPRTLIARPQMKAQAWKDLQMFAKRDVL